MVWTRTNRCSSHVGVDLDGATERKEVAIRSVAFLAGRGADRVNEQPKGAVTALVDLRFAKGLVTSTAEPLL